MFIPRHPVVENQFCSYASQTGSGAAGIGGVLAYAGSVVYLDASADNQEPMVMKMVTDQTPFGFLMQKVKTGYHQVHPAGFMMPGDLGSSDVIAQPLYDATGNISGTKAVPAGVAHLGIWDTVHYTVTDDDPVLPGEALVASQDEAKVTQLTAGLTPVNTTVVARVVKGASVAKAAANKANTTLYPIRIKLLV